jgi:hypothetical protein
LFSRLRSLALVPAAAGLAIVVTAMLGCGSSTTAHPDAIPPGPFTFDASAALPHLCSDGTACPNGPVSMCSDGAFCIALNAHVASTPAGIRCGANPDETDCIASFPGGTTLHITTTGGGTSGCNMLVCNYSPPITAARSATASCDVTFVLTADTSIGFMCLNP